MENSVHVVNYKGHRFEVWWHGSTSGKRERRHIVLTSGNQAVIAHRMGLRYWMDRMLHEHKKEQAERAKMEYIRSLTTEEIVTHRNYSHAQRNGEKYDIYWKDATAKHGSVKVRSCPDWLFKGLEKKHCLVIFIPA